MPKLIKKEQRQRERERERERERVREREREREREKAPGTGRREFETAFTANFGLGCNPTEITVAY
jgi:hypothetical protein